MPVHSASAGNAIEAIIELGGIEENQLDSLPSSGSYALIIKVTKRVSLKPDKPWTIEPGIYIYAGRASRGLSARIARHKKRIKPIHWHIDRLTTHQSATVKNVLILPDHPEEECAIIRVLMNIKTSAVPHANFGSSDCREACPAHLIMATIPYR